MLFLFNHPSGVVGKGGVEEENDEENMKKFEIGVCW